MGFKKPKGAAAAAAAMGAFKFKKSGGANAAEKRNGVDRTDAQGRSGFGATKPPTREGYINLAPQGSKPMWIPKVPRRNPNGFPPRKGGMRILNRRMGGK